jgi:MraZ protein
VFVGSKVHSIDEKGRVTLPASMRDLLGDRAYVSKYDGCLAIWTTEKFTEVAGLMEERARNGEISDQVVRSFASSAEMVNLDKAGRISIAEHLRSYAHLELGGEAMLAGRLSRIEVWAPAAFDEQVGGAAEAELTRELKTRSV